MTEPAPADKPRIVGVALALVVLIGSALRLCAIRDQVLLDDEWHGLYYVMGRDLGYLLTHFSVPGATSIPLNVYSFALLHTVGWSETLLRLPSIIAGIASLVFLPMLAARLVGRREALLFGAMVAISPFLVFYSRQARPYGPTVLLGGVAVLAGCLWVRDGKTRDVALYLLSGIAAVYFHLYAAPAVVAPLVCAAAFNEPRRRLGVRRVALFAIAMAIALGVLVLPALLESLGSTMPNVLGAGRMKWQVAWGVVSLFSGTSVVALTACVVGLVVLGVAAVFKQDRVTAAAFLVALALYILAFIVAAPNAMRSPIVVSRYCIALFPVAYLLAACGLREASGLLFKKSAPAVVPILRAVPECAFPVALLLAGPLIPLYLPQNDFTNHIAFQQSYEPPTWERSHEREFIESAAARTAMTIGKDEISPFYSTLAEDPSPRTIIEYPMMVGDHFNPYYYYQHFHGKRVMVGYVLDLPMRDSPGTGRFVYGNTFIDEVLGLASDPSKLHFRNLVNVLTARSIVDSGADYVVIHKEFEAEWSGVTLASPTVERLRWLCRKSFGNPVFEDRHVAAFAVKR